MSKLCKNPVVLFIISMMLLSSCSARPMTKEPQAERVPQPEKVPVSSEWKEADPAQQGMDPQILSKADDYIKSEFSNVCSLVVIKNGYLVYERYYLEKGKNDPVHVFSVTKSVMSSLMGIAVREGFVKNLDQKLADFYPEYFANIDNPKKKQITLRHALTMTAGFEPADRNFSGWFSSKSWFEYTIRQQLISQPGEKFNYDTGLTHLLSGVISKASKISTLEFANKFLFSQIGIDKIQWGSDNEGNYGGGHLLSLTPRDMAKFGYLYLGNGNWKGKQVIPKEWVAESTQKQVEVDKNSGYGYLWWVNKSFDNSKNKYYKVFSAIGYGGQRIDVFPEMDVVAVVTTDTGKSAKNNGDTYDINKKYVIPAVK